MEIRDATLKGGTPRHVTPDGRHPHLDKAKVACSRLLEPANSARRGHPRTVPHPKMSSKGRTELQLRLSGAKNAKEVTGNVLFSLAPQKVHENAKNTIFEWSFRKFRKFPNVSERIRMLPNMSERVQTGPNGSKQVRAG